MTDNEANLINALQNLIDATSGQALVTGKESIRVLCARKRACAVLAEMGIEPRVAEVWSRDNEKD